VQEFDPKAKFQPSLLNTSVYLLSLTMQVSTFAINYQGRPFREGLRENRNLFWSLSIVFGVAFVGVLGLVPDMNDSLELVAFPTEDVRYISSFARKFHPAGADDGLLSFLVE
jgi:cation-transporting ATPase 13A1